MAHSLIGADRGTHVKIVGMALIGAMALVTIGITARVTGHDPAMAALQAQGPVLKVGRPAVFTVRDVTIIR